MLGLAVVQAAIVEERLEQINRTGDKARAEVLEKEANKELRSKSSGPRNGNGPFYSPVRSSAEIDVSS
jgi:hypothetical protein